MLTLYTAVGTLKFQKSSQGRQVPLVTNHGQEYGLSQDELVLWSCLAFQILQIQELQQVYEQRRKQANCPEGLSFSHYLNRLLLRGLITKGEGLTGVDALYRLLGRLYISPIEDRFAPRLFSCIHLYLEGSIKEKDFHKYLQKKKLTPMEETILKLAQKVPLTTAELVTCMDQGSIIHNEKDIMEQLYTESDTTEETLVDKVQLHNTQYPVLQAVSNLYLNKQISFQKY